jgi:hypothetical protein
MKKLFVLTLALGLFCATESLVLSQEQPTQQQPTAEELEKQKAEREKNAYRLLDQVINEAQSLRLTENRVRVQINAADMLWDHNQGRARTLFVMAGEGVAEMGRTPQPTGNRRGEAPPERRSFQLRQELVLAAAKHDASLAYQLLASTKPPAPVATNIGNERDPRVQFNAEDSLEQTLLGRIAALDPKLAAQNAEQMMEKGQFPRTLTEVINQLHRQDPEAAAKLADKTVKRIQSANLLTNNEAAVLAQSLLTPGVRLPASESATAATPVASAPQRGRAPVLEQSAYVDLLSSVIDSALKATPPSQTNRAAPQRVRTPGVPTARPGQGTGPTENQTEQNNARRLLAGLQVALPIIDQYLPTKAPMVRQKLSEMGLANNSPLNVAQTFNALQGNLTVDALVQAASTLPPQMQPRIYQQAAFSALEEGNPDRARQIATDHLPVNMRDSVMQRIEFRELVRKADTARFEEIRQMLTRLQSDNEKIDLLIQLAGDAHKTNPKLALQLLEEAKQMTSRRAANYDHFEQQLKVARAFSAVDPARSFDVLDPGISQLNELLSAAAVLNGFEVNMFRDGEMSMQGGNGLTTTVTRFGRELAVLARTDLERSETLAGRFQFAEPRIMARLSIVQGLLDVRPSQDGPNVNNLRGLGQNFNIVRPE